MSEPDRRAFGLLGSGEFEPWAEEVDRWLLERAPRGGTVLVAPTASAPEGDEVFGGWARRGLEHYGRLGAPAEVLPLRTRRDAEDASLASRLDDAAMIFFSGGNPAYLAATLAGTRFWERLLGRVREGLAFGGCSAGVAVLGHRALDPSVADPMTADLWKTGLGVFDHTVFVPHWDVADDYIPGFRARVERTVAGEVTLVGLDERTALLGDGRSWRVVGEGSARVRADGSWTAYGSGQSVQGGVLEVARA